MEIFIFCLDFNANSQIAFHGISINKKEIVLDGSEAPVRIDAEALLSLENLVPTAVLNKVRVVGYLEYIHIYSLSTSIFAGENPISSC